jgi:hypothetical protein
MADVQTSDVDAKLAPVNMGHDTLILVTMATKPFSLRVVLILV